MGLSRDPPEGVVTEREKTPEGSRSPNSANDEQPDVVKVEEDTKQDADAKDTPEPSASLADYFVRFISTKAIY